LRSPKSEGCIIATSGGRPEEVIENTGRIGFWRRTAPGEKILMALGLRKMVVYIQVGNGEQ